MLRGGGVIYNRLGRQFLSPFINLWLTTEDFIKFLYNYKFYLSSPLRDIGQDEYGNPLGKINDIKIHFNHYKSFDEAKKCWERRVKRINFNNLYVIIREADFDNTYIEPNVAERLATKFNNLVVLTRRKVDHPLYNILVYPNNMREFTKDRYGIRIWERQFNWIRFLNCNSQKPNKFKK